MTRFFTTQCAAALLSLPFVVGCPRASCPTIPHTDAARLMRMHRSQHRTIGAIRAEARVDQRGENGRIRGTVLMLLERPGSVRFDALTQLGPAAILTANEESFQLLDMRESRFFEGEACPENIARLLGVAMPAADVARLLVGDSPRIEAPDGPALACGDEGYVVSLQAEDGTRQELAYEVRAFDMNAPPEEQHLRLVRSEVFAPDGTTRWRVTFHEHEVVADPLDGEGRGVAMPEVIRFEDPVREADVLVRFKSIELLSESPGADVFQQSAPAGAPAETLSCPPGWRE